METGGEKERERETGEKGRDGETERERGREKKEEMEVWGETAYSNVSFRNKKTWHSVWKKFTIQLCGSKSRS